MCPPNINVEDFFERASNAPACLPESRPRIGCATFRESFLCREEGARVDVVSSSLSTDRPISFINAVRIVSLLPPSFVSAIAMKINKGLYMVL
jgi:hypothetical protein